MAVLRVLLLAGGQSDEHEISLLSARNVAQGLRQAGVMLSLRVITKTGRLLPADESEHALRAGSAVQGGMPLGALSDAVSGIDVVFPLLHGPMGEDGTIQGMLKLLNVPFVGSDVLGSAVCMDKAMSKEVLRAGGISQVGYRLVTSHEFTAHRAAIVADIAQRLPSPWFVKPANLGSSVGVRKVKSVDDLPEALMHALNFDRRVIVEAGVEQARELEVAVLGNDAPVASVIGEITYQGEFYDYEAKYTEGRSQMVIPARVPAEVQRQIQALATQAFVALDCAGLARVDFFYREHDQTVYLNELNTMPGFTAFSMYPSMWKHSGVSYEQLLLRLVQLAAERAQGRLPRALGPSPQQRPDASRA